MKRRCSLALVLTVLLVAGAVAAYLLWRREPIAVPLPIPNQIRVDASPFGQLLYGADKVRLTATAEIKPGRYQLGTSADTVLVTIPAGTTVCGTAVLAIWERGEDDRGRWVRVRASSGRLAFAPPVRVEGRYGVAEVGQLGADEAGVTATVALRLWESGVVRGEADGEEERLAVGSNAGGNGQEGALAGGNGFPFQVEGGAGTAGMHLSDLENLPALVLQEDRAGSLLAWHRFAQVEG